MKKRILFTIFLLALATVFPAAGMPFAPAPDGAEIVGLWDFSNAGSPAQDGSSNNWPGRVLAGQPVEYAPGCFAFQPCIDEGDKEKPSGISVFSHDALIPEGAMAFEIWFKLDEGVNDLERSRFMLFDKKIYFYKTDKPDGNGGYCLYLDRLGENAYRMTSWVGFGDKSMEASTGRLAIPAGEWHCAAMTYNGDGRLSLYLDGTSVRQAEFPKGCGSLAQNKIPLTIGDRAVSYYSPFAGLVAQAALYKGIPDRYGLQPAFEVLPGRDVFYRFDKYPEIRLRLTNSTGADFSDIRIFQDGRELASMRQPELKRDGRLDYEAKVDTTLKAGRYTHEFRVEFKANGKTADAKCLFTYDLTPRPTPYMPVVMWNTADDLNLLKELGFTSDMAVLGSHDRVLETGAPVTADDNSRQAHECEMLNRRARLGLRNVFWMIPGAWLSNKLKDDPKYARLNRDGRPIPNTNADVVLPEFKKFAENVGRTVALQFGNFTSAEGSLIHSEVRDNSEISFRPENIEAAREAGAPIPDAVSNKKAVDYRSLPDFPANRVVPSDDPILKFYSWWWKHGDGWNDLHSIVSRAIKSTGREDIWTFFDPAVRTPSVWGNGGDVDVISQWTYSYPDPIKVGEAADELFAMAEGNPGQKVMKMTQVIWYRDRTAPVGMLPKEESLRTEWEKDVPDAKFVTIAPDHLSIALWSMLARPVRGIMYHGWYSLVDRNHSSKSYYKFTNGESAMRLKALTGAVVKPLGPMLLEVGDRQADVAMLESFSSQIYASCGSWGWSDGWESDVHLILQWAGYQPRIVYEETIRKNGLDAFRVLVMPNCEVLPQDIVDAIHDFQKKGGIVVGDRLLCPAIVPDYTITRYNRTKAADKDKEQLQELSKELRKALDPYLPTPFRTSNMDLVGRMRQHGTSDYLFVMNDRRTYGDYVGQYRLVMEKGLPNAGRVSLARTGGFVYDLVKHIPVKTATSDGLSWDVELGPGEGGLYLATSTALEEVRITAPEEASRGGEFSFTVAITDKAGKLSDAVVPLRVDIATPEGETEGTGYYAAVDGVLEVKVNPAKNDMPGAWTIRVQDLASGNDSAATVQVK